MTEILNTPFRKYYTLNLKLFLNLDLKNDEEFLLFKFYKRLISSVYNYYDEIFQNVKINNHHVSKRKEELTSF